MCPDQHPVGERSEHESDSWAGRRGLVFVLIGFWALWFTVVFLTNLFDGLVHLGVLADGWAFRSGNYEFLAGVMGVYALPAGAVGAVFAVGVFWEALVAGLMWWTALGYARGTARKRRLFLAFIPAVSFFGAFMMLTEVFIAYELASTQVRLFIATLLSAVVVERWWGSDRGSGPGSDSNSQ